MEGSPTPSLLKDGAHGADALSSVSHTSKSITQKVENTKSLKEDMPTFDMEIKTAKEAREIIYNVELFFKKGHQLTGMFFPVA